MVVDLVFRLNNQTSAPKSCPFLKSLQSGNQIVKDALAEKITGSWLSDAVQHPGFQPLAILQNNKSASIADFQTRQFA